MYSGPLREVIARFKYGNLRFLANDLSELLAARVRDEALSGYQVVPVPLHRKRQGSRGYNQSALLAKSVSRKLGLRYESKGLERTRETDSQVGRNIRDRSANVKNAFGVGSMDFNGKDILLVDDISTTGATLEACARACRIAGASSVRAAVLARG